MFKLPVCPYCHTVYRYGDVKKTAMKKEEKCYHCKNTFRVSKKPAIVLLLILIVVAVALNVAQLFMTPHLNMIVLFGTNVILILIAILFVPFFVSFRKTDKNK